MMMFSLTTICLIVSSTFAAKSASAPTTVDGNTTLGTSSSASASSTSRASDVRTPQNTTTTTAAPIKPPADEPNTLDGLRTINFSMTKPEPARPNVTKQCSPADLCDAIGGICINGTCKMTTECPRTIECICNPGYTGNFCDTKETKPAKEHVNGVIPTTTARKDIVENASHRSTKMKMETQTPATTTDMPLQEQKSNEVKKSTTVSADVTTTSSSKSGASNTGYVKGPEVYVPTDSSIVKVKSSKSEILTDKPTVLSQISDSVPLSTVSMNDTRVGVPQESSAGIGANRKSASGGQGSVKETTQKTTKQGASVNRIDNNSGVSNKHHNVISKSEIVQGNDTLLTEVTGTVEHSKSTIAASNILAASDIKITIEAAKTESKNQMVGENLPTTENVPTKTQRSVVKTQTKATDQKAPVVNKKTLTVAKPVNNSDRTNIAGQNNVISKNGTQKDTPKQDSVPNSDSLSAAEKVLVSSDFTASASQHTEMRKSMQSSVLNPLFKFLSIIGSPTFVDNVSAVKIEIITKPNDTSVAKSDNAIPPNKSDNVSPTNTNSKVVEAASQTERSVVDNPVRNKTSGTP